jgi:hypothetical protein
MKMLNIRKHKAILATGLLMLTSCENFLDVEPDSQVKGEVMFSDETGFKEALAGVYTSMVDNRNYAKELRFGLVGVLGSEWDYYPTSSYQDAALYQYDQATPKGMISSMWSSMYNSIANVNNIITQIDSKKGKFTGENYSVIKGESYGLRALLHFDLLRCFGVSYAVDSTKAAIPYCTALIKGSFPQLKVHQVIDKVLADLDTAEICLQNDPIKTGEEITETDDNGYLMNRQMHFNYYAVKALQARVHMWRGDYAKAKACAQEVVEATAFTWSTQENIMNGVDNSYASEHIFALNHEKLSNLSDAYFNPDQLTNAFHSENATIDALYENDTDDYRYAYTFANGKDAYTSRRFIKKYGSPYNNPSSTDDDVTNMYFSNKMPIIRLSEMYLILSECEYQEESFYVLDGLNAVRAARGVKILTRDPDDYYTTLINEYKKEFMGEGQMFFLYKRLNIEYLPNSSESMILTKGYTFPIPDSEKEAAIREENR